jgi:hypothetical protein
MSIYEQVDVGANANDMSGDSFRASFIKINSNFTLLETLGINAQTGTTYPVVLTDAGLMITMTNVAANIVTIPANASVAFPIGTQLNFMQAGAGTTSIAITTDTLNVAGSLSLDMSGQYYAATALKIAATEWVLFGGLA